MSITPLLTRARVIAIGIVATLAALAYLTHETWQPWLHPPEVTAPKPAADALPPSRVLVNEKAQQNLGITAKPAVVASYWKRIQVPGIVIDRPAQSDRYVSAPLAGVVQTIHHIPGDTVRAGDKLFTLRILSETLHQTQADLFKTIQDIGLAQAQRERLLAAGDAVPRAKVIDIENQLARLEAGAKAYRQELANRGLSGDQIARIGEGRFESEIPIVAPTPAPASSRDSAGGIRPAEYRENVTPVPTFEFQELKVEAGQQVQAGQMLCLLSNHRTLAIEGRAYREETPMIEQSLKEKWTVEADFQEESSTLWPPNRRPLFIEQLASVIDPNTRTFNFLIPLDNESRTVEQDGRTKTLWRYRPGQKVLMFVNVEEIKNVFVLPAEAVTRDGAESYIFTQNVNMFDRKSVHVVLQDRQHAIIANDGSVMPGMFVAQTAATQLNRMLKSQGSTVPKGYHIHADGSLHKNADEGK